MTAKPKPVNSFTFNYAVGNLKKEAENAFLLDCPAQALQMKMGDLYETYKCIFEGWSGFPKYQ